ncbi:MAG: sugar phosphate isomerase/epimerase [Candidatus Pacearchaeota archaeon]|nr:sugar phosphate isomerase/epimerase [Candidatus Pacearchaeota archaeon]
MMLIENPPSGFGLSTGEDLKNLVVKSREEFVKRAKEKGMSGSMAEDVAEKIIGATWDVGHINMLRKQGFKDEDIVRETEKIAPYVKHVHLSDNFGFEHTELPMGMGNVPMKEIMEKLGEKGFEAKKIIEAGTWWTHFQTNPMKESLEGLGSPMYSIGGGPYWNQSLGLQQGYFSGYGMMLPSNNYQTFGAGFSQLPQELGGEVARAGGGRFSQKGME